MMRDDHFNCRLEFFFIFVQLQLLMFMHIKLFFTASPENKAITNEYFFLNEHTISD